MDEGKKHSRWAESLSEAGLLDEIEDSWALPEDKPIDGSIITVEGSPGEGEPAAEPPEVQPAGGGPAATLDGAGAARLPQTPVERKRSSDPRPAAPTDASSAPLVPALRPSQIDAPASIPSAKRTFSGIPTAPPRSPSHPPSDPPIELELLDLEPVEGSRAEEEDAAVVQVRGSRISVPPDAHEQAQEAQAEIIDAPPVGADQVPFREQMSQRYEAGDYTGALEIAEELLREDPQDPEALRYSESCREVLIQMYEARIGPFDRIPKVAVSEHELIWRNLDPASGFVLSRIDGYSTFEDIIDISGLPRFETCRILGQLLQEGIIE